VAKARPCSKGTKSIEAENSSQKRILARQRLLGTAQIEPAAEGSEPNHRKREKPVFTDSSGSDRETDARRKQTEQQLKKITSLVELCVLLVLENGLRSVPETKIARGGSCKTRISKENQVRNHWAEESQK
jgi:hypothetical protein